MDERVGSQGQYQGFGNRPQFPHWCELESRELSELVQVKDLARLVTQGVIKRWSLICKCGGDPATSALNVESSGSLSLSL